MSKRTYDIATTTSLFLIAASAILSDKLPNYFWIFGGIGVSCALISTFIYFKYGMRKVREPRQVNDQASVPDNLSYGGDATGISASLAQIKCGSLTLLKDDEVQKDITEIREAPSESITSLGSIDVASLFFERIVVMRHARARTFADEVVEIVKGLTKEGEEPVYEFEFKADGTFKVSPCVVHPRQSAVSDEKKRFPEGPSIKLPIRAIN
jgi:hypothetical protein